MENQKKTTNSLARRMGISLICGLAAGLLLMMLRENLNSSGQEAVWKTINRYPVPGYHSRRRGKRPGTFLYPGPAVHPLAAACDRTYGIYIHYPCHWPDL